MHANALQNLLDGEFIRPMSTWAQLLLVLVVAGLAGVVPFWRGAGLGAVVLLLLALGLLAVGFWAYLGELFLPGGAVLLDLGPPYLVVPIATSLLAIGLAYLGSVAYVSVVEGRDKRFIKGALGMNSAPDG